MDSYNSAVVTGSLVGPIKEDHAVYGETFYSGAIKVNRLSGASDTLLITIPGRLLGFLNPETLASPIEVNGNVRSYSKLVDGHNRMYVTLFAKSIVPADGNDAHNDAHLTGTICKQPTYRVTPFGREICDLMVAGNRRFDKSDYIPCIVWGRNALWASHLNVGDHVSLAGRLQSREYDKLTDWGEYVTRTAYELSAYMIERAVEEVKEIL